MKKSVRGCVFETNSSSTHSIVVVSEESFEGLDSCLPTKVCFELGDFGWETEVLTSISEKAAYLYTAIVTGSEYHKRDPKKLIGKIEELLNNVGVECEFQEVDWDNDSWSVGGYIDHVDELGEFFDMVVDDDGKLLRFLFSRRSLIISTNDNSCSDIEYSTLRGISYQYDLIYKGN